MRGPVGAVAVGGGAGVSDRVAELSVGVAHHVTQVLPTSQSQRLRNCLDSMRRSKRQTWLASRS